MITAVDIISDYSDSNNNATNSSLEATDCMWYQPVCACAAQAGVLSFKALTLFKALP